MCARICQEGFYPALKKSTFLSRRRQCSPLLDPPQGSPFFRERERKKKKEEESPPPLLYYIIHKESVTRRYYISLLIFRIINSQHRGYKEREFPLDIMSFMYNIYIYTNYSFSERERDSMNVSARNCCIEKVVTQLWYYNADSYE